MRSLNLPEVPHLGNSLWGSPTPNKTLICTCIVSRFKANGIMLYFNNVELGLMASPKGLPVLPATQKTGGTSAFFAPDSLHVRVSPPVWKVPYSHAQGACKVETTLQIILNVLCLLLSFSHEHSTLQQWPVRSLWTECINWEPSYPQEGCER